MLKIGDFSKISRVSIRMLRHYDDIGLLKPAEIDDLTGYRYYREDQLFVIGRITALKDMGFALADIVRILEMYKMMLLDSARNRLRKEKNMGFDVTVKTIPERYAATVHTIVPRYEDEGMAWAAMGECKEPLVPADPCFSIAEFWDDEYKEKDVEIEVSMSVKGRYQDTEHVKFKTLPAVKVASCVVKGSYDQMPDAYATVISWINANGYKTSKPMFNIYHVSPAQCKDPGEYVTEVCFPID